MSDAEVRSCDCVCSIPMGRLQESISLSHAVSIVLFAIYSQRLAHVNAQGAYVVESAAGLDAGVDTRPEV